MEPRIAKLLGDSLHDRTTLDPISLLPPPSVAPLRPHPVEPPPVGDEARANATPRRSDYVGNDHFGSKRSPVSTPSNRQKSSVSIAEVLNKENPTSTPPQPLPTLPTASTTPFSGRLSDILLDPSQEFPNKRRKVDEHNAQPALAGGENALLKLPKLPQLPKKTTKRPRIPPLLQGLHQPPPLPEKLFPPITGEGSGFGRDIGERVGLANAAGLPRGKETDIEIIVETGATIANHDVNPRKGKEKEVEVEKEKDDPPVVGEPSAAALGDKYDQDLPEKEHRAPEEFGKVKETRKRNKWTEQETKDLLVGVSRFGIGNWKKILQCPEFTFNGRTAVDLKDRFRTCCPGEGLKVRKPKAKGNALDAEPQNPNDSFNSTHEQDGSSQEVVPNDGATSKQRKPRGDIHRKGPAELAKMGIQGPFVKSKRRERREFTEKDDENLLKGFEKYGAVWHSMRDDQELGFSMRHPTDLRDRFRIRYPEKYAKAGYKLKPKDEQMLRDKEKETTVTQETIAAPGGSHISDIPKDKEKERENAEEMASAETLVTVPSMVTSSTSNLRAHALLQPLLNSFPTPLEEVVDLASEDGDAAQSPIILNRNIFQWADANPSQLTSSTTIPNVGNLTSDISLNLFTGMEDVNSLAAIQLPLASVTSLPSYAQTSNPLTLSLPVNPTLSSNAQILNGPSNSSNAPTHAAISSAKASANSLLRTPNLPTIVFPHVPAASARSAVHNLPPPADLLSGLDLDPRTESQAGSFFIDDSLGFTLPSGASGLASTSTLAPLIGNNSGAGNAGRGILGAERGLLDDSLGLGMSERR